MITAKDAATALRNVASKLVGAGILLPESQGILEEVAGRLSKKRDEVDWDLDIPEDRPLRFSKTVDKNDDEIIVCLSAKLIRVNQSNESTSPFESLDAAIVVLDMERKQIARWHIDRGNVGPNPQQGPLFHLQYGGHHPGSTDPDPRLQVPRWCHPPLEIGLLCEVIAANFFHDKWNEQLRREPGWCSAIHTFQCLCFEHYLKNMQGFCINRQVTALGSMWADEWS